MACYIERTGVLAHDDDDHPNGQGKGRKKVNHTLEDVAEEMLNGMFCHYEPPDPRRARKNTGILRKRNNMVRRNEQKNVRWIDGVDSNNVKQPATPIEIRCNVASNCVDAAVEGGCMSPKKKTKAQKFLSKYDYDLRETASNASEDTANSRQVAGILRKKKKNKKKQKSLKFDDDGNLSSAEGAASAPLPPPPPPPPSRNEKFIPELCGVQINCGEDDEHMDYLARSSALGPPAKHYRRPRQPYDYDDEKNSLVEEGDPQPKERAPISVPIPAPSSGTRKSRRFLGKAKQQQEQEQQQSDGDDDWETSSNTSSLFRRMWPNNRNKSKVLSDYQVAFDGDLDPVEMVRTDSTTGRRKASKRQQARAVKNTGGDDWDESQPIVPAKNVPVAAVAAPSTAVVPVVKSRGCSQSPTRAPVVQSRGRSKSPASNPVIQGRGRSKSPGVSSKSSKGRSKSPSRRWSLSSKKEARDPSPGPIRRSRSRSRENNRRSLDSSAVRRVRSKSPLKSALRTKSFDGNDTTHQDAMERMSFITDHRRGFLESAAAAVPAQLTSLPPMQPQQQQGRPQMRPEQPPMAPQMQQMQAGHAQFHPAHPLSRPEMRDDDMERQSFITMHRQGFATAMPPVDDAMERQSFITMHRQGFDGQAPPPPPFPKRRTQQATAMAADDRMERESFITGHRQGFETTGVPTANTGGRRGRSKSPRRSRSPYRRSHSFEQEFSTDGGAHQTAANTRPRGRSQERSLQQDPRRMSDPLAYQQRMQQPINGQMHSATMTYPQSVNTMGQPASSVFHPVVESHHAAPEVAPKVESEMTWEEKTRLAWENLRGTVTESLASAVSFDASKTPQSPTFPREGLSRSQSSDRKVTFGQDEIRMHPSREDLFQDEYNESQQTMMPHPGKKVKKKKVFRGRKLLTGFMGRGNRGKHNKHHLPGSRSLDMTLTASSTMSKEWSENNDDGGMREIPNGRFVA